jgi:hypothetical protein
VAAAGIGRVRDGAGWTATLPANDGFDPGGTCRALAAHDDGTVTSTAGFAGFTRRRGRLEVAS